MSNTALSPRTDSSAADEMLFQAAAIGQTHPNQLAALARIFGVAAVDPSKARVLEIGSGNGANILPMAEHLPGATFLGIDISEAQIVTGRKAIVATGLQNIELRPQHVKGFSAAEGKFDYIIAHGVYSLVPGDVREKLLAICTEHLSPNGVAFVSYNSKPGWNMRRSLRDMMLYHTRLFPDPKTKVQQARALLSFMADSVPADNNAYGILLKNELSVLGNYPDAYLLRELLGKENSAFYFHEFVADADRHGLQYLAESSIAEMLASNFPDRIRNTLEQLNNQLVAQEQYMDFLRNRTFRRTLLCRKGVRIQRNIAPALLTGFSFRSLLRGATGPIELVPGMNVAFTTFNGVQISSSDVFLKAVLSILAETRSVAAISYRELLETARARSRPFLGEVPANRNDVDEVTLQGNLVNLLSKGIVEIYAEPVRVRTDVPDKPLVGTLTRYEALNARLITNRLHQPVPADLFSRYVIAACDGTRTHGDILEALVQRVKDNALQVNEGSAKVTEPQRLRKLFQPRVEAALIGMANSGFFAS